MGTIPYTLKTIYHTTLFSFENFQKTITTLTKYLNDAFGVEIGGLS